LQTSA